MGEVSATRLYLGNLPRNATKQDVADHFAAHGTGEIVEIKLMNGFGFLEYKDGMDARDVVPGEPHPSFHGTDFMGERLVVQFARGGNRPTRDYDGPSGRAPPRPRRTVHRMTIDGLPGETSWQDLKDFARQPGLDVVYSEVSRDRDGSGAHGFVEYETANDLGAAVEKLDGSDFKGAPVRCISDPQSELPRGPPPGPPRDRYRSRSPPPRRGYGPPPDDYYDRRPPPRGYSPRRDDYRRRSPPPPRGYYDDRRGPPEPYPPRSPPPARRGPPPMDDYPPPPRGRYPPEDPYGAPPPPRRGYADDPYANGHGREPPRESYGRPPSPPRRDRGYDTGYDRPPRY